MSRTQGRFCVTLLALPRFGRDGGDPLRRVLGLAWVRFPTGRTGGRGGSATPSHPSTRTGNGPASGPKRVASGAAAACGNPAAALVSCRHIPWLSHHKGGLPCCA